MRDILFAKKTSGHPIYQTLEGHTEDCVAALGCYLRHHRQQAARLAWDIDLAYRDFCHILYLAVFLHDLGKATAEFQEHMAKETLERRLAHTFFGLPLVKTDLPPEHNLLVRALVLSHHTQPYDDMYFSHELAPEVNYQWDGIREFMSRYEEFHARWLAEEFSLAYQPLLENNNPAKGPRRDHILPEVQRLRRQIHRLEPLYRTKALYCATITILKQCDQLSSKTFNLYPARPGQIYGSLWNRVHPGHPAGQDKKSHPAPAPQQAGRDTSQITARVLEVARNRGRQKLIWVTPGQLASIRRWRDLTALFGEDRVGLLHALSYFPVPRVFFKEPDNNKGSRGNTAHLKYGDRIFSRPVTVTTIDHLIFSLAHGCRQADYALGNVLDAAVIFDGRPEDYPGLSGYWQEAVQIFNNLKVPCYYYDHVSDLLEPACKNKTAAGILPRDTFTVQVKEVAREIDTSQVAAYAAGEATQVVIAGSLTRAQGLYLALQKKLPGVPVLLYHTLFTRHDRYIKPGSLVSRLEAFGRQSGPWVVVATDALLDAAAISCDILHLSRAPLPALARRLTLLGQSRQSPGLVYLYGDPAGSSPGAGLPETFIYPPHILARLQKLRDQIKPRPTNLEEVMNHCTVFGYSPPEVRYAGEASKINLWPFEERLMDVIPAVFWRPQLKDDPVAAEQVTVKVPLTWHGRFPHLFREIEHPLETIIICHLPYHLRLGLLLREGQDIEF
ncbi:MAG: CRISPR-associated endonuclease Cas3'' [Bacillota bacterium]